MIPEKYDTMIWGVILLVAITLATVAVLLAMPDAAACQPVRFQTPMMEAVIGHAPERVDG